MIAVMATFGGLPASLSAVFPWLAKRKPGQLCGVRMPKRCLRSRTVLFASITLLRRVALSCALSPRQTLPNEVEFEYTRMLVIHDWLRGCRSALTDASKSDTVRTWGWKMETG